MEIADNILTALGYKCFANDNVDRDSLSFNLASSMDVNIVGTICLVRPDSPHFVAVIPLQDETYEPREGVLHYYLYMDSCSGAQVYNFEDLLLKLAEEKVSATLRIFTQKYII